MNRIIVLLLGVLLCGCGKNETASPDKKQITIGVSLLNLSSEFIVMVNQAMEAKAKEMGVRLVINDAQRNAERQVQQAESFIAQKVDAIILNPCEVEASSPAVDKALAAGIPIVNVNSETKSSPTAFVGSRDEESARIAMEYIATRLNGKGNIVMMHGFMGQAAQIKREQGAREFLARQPGLKLIADQKWANGYICRKCGNTNYCRGKSPHSRRCTRCKHEESATSHTIFHRCHIPITEAFRIAYMVCHDPTVSTYEISRVVELRQMTCWKLKTRLMECIRNRGEVDILYQPTMTPDHERHS